MLCVTECSRLPCQHEDVKSESFDHHLLGPCASTSSRFTLNSEKQIAQWCATIHSVINDLQLIAKGSHSQDARMTTRLDTAL